MRRVAVPIVFVALALIAWWAVRADSDDPGGPPGAGAPRPGPVEAAVGGALGDEAARDPATPGEERSIVRESPTARGRGALAVLVTLEPDGEPLPCVAVRAVARDGRDERSTERVSATDADGRAVFADLEAGPWHVVLDRGPEADVDVPAGSAVEFAISVPPGVDAIVRVLDASGGRVPAADVLLWTASGMLDVPTWKPGVVVGRTGTDGELSVRALPHLRGHGSWFAARHPAFGWSSTRMVRSPASEDDTAPRIVELQLGAGGAHVDLRVVGPDGGALEGAVASARPFDAPSSEDDGNGRVLRHAFRLARTDGQGRATLGPLAAGGYRLRVHARRHAPYREPIHVRGTEPLVRNVVLGSEARARGRVTESDGTPIADARVTIQLERLGETARTAADGAFRFDGLEAGEAEWRADHPRYRRASGAVDLAAGEAPELRIVLEPLAALHGRILDDAGHGLAGWSISATSDLPGYSDDRRNGRTGSDGGFDLPARGDLEYELVVREPGQLIPAPLPELGRLRARDEPWIIRVPDEARATAFVEGFLVDATGRPALAGQHVSIAGHGFHAHPGSTMPPAEIDSSAGRFRLGPLPPGVYVLWFSGQGRVEFAVPDVVLRPRSMTRLGRIELPATGTFRAELTAEDGLLLGDVLIQLTGENGADIVRVDAETLTAQKPMLPGRYQLVVYGGGFRSLRATIEVVPGETVTHRGTLRAAVSVGLRFHMPEGEKGATFVVCDARGEQVFDVELEEGLRSEDWWPSLDRGSFTVDATGASGRRYFTRFTVDSLERRETPVELRVKPVR